MAHQHVLRGTWDLSGPRLESVSPALAGGFLTTAPPGKSHILFFECHNVKTLGSIMVVESVLLAFDIHFLFLTAPQYLFGQLPLPWGY